MEYSYLYYISKQIEALLNENVTERSAFTIHNRY